jgi:hypothetical protein
MTYGQATRLASGLLLPPGMKIEVKAEGPDPSPAGHTTWNGVEVLEGGDEFLEALTMRLNEIVRKPSGRFVISYVPGTPGAKKPPRIQ